MNSEQNAGIGAPLVERDVNFLQFVSTDEQNLLVSVFTLRNEITLLENVRLLFDEARTTKKIPKAHALTHHLLVLVQYHLYCSFAAFCRCHPEESFASMRVAIDAALHAARIFAGDLSPASFVENERSAIETVRAIRKKRERDPRAYAETTGLLHMWKCCSGAGSHADYGMLEGRSVINDTDEGVELAMKFATAYPEPVQRYLALTLVLTFCDILGVFSNNLVAIVKCVPNEWENRRRVLFNAIFDERSRIKDAAQEALESDPRISELLSGRS